MFLILLVHTFAGTARFAKNLQHYKTISEASATNKPKDLDITHQMESFLYLICSDNIGKWKKTVQILAKLNKGNCQCEQIRVCDAKERAEFLNQHESKVDVYWLSWEECQELKMPHTRAHAGQNLFGG